MTWNEVLLIVLFSFGAGVVTSCGYFALFMTVGVISRFVQFTHTAGKERLYENLVITGVTIGNVFFTFTPREFLPSAVWVVFSVFAGMFTGCFLIALAEAVKGIPVFARRVRLRTGFVIILFFLALGKALGALFYFSS